MWLPATWPQHASGGASHTWSAGHRPRRLDYVAVPQSIDGASYRAYVDEKFDVGNGGQDHLAVCLRMEWCCGTDARLPQRRVMRYSRAAANDPESAECFRQALQQWRVPGWDVDINDHWADAWQATLGAARDAFHVAVAPRRSHVSQEAWRLIQQRGACKAIMLEAFRTRR
eukprot:7117895-Lingulodinium_polyedra.AAC.1